ncbi:hypothetical protein [Sphingobium lignivorans]|uniref:Uncharacterized protein n=1 Tax=Sphingobium lignivorans TaxID=2735886 RepID=A0ABR6NG59_9SPHN|nr:hypothetical protein [Sphingobium lignivorans]MBB5986277.1 hypothetical protein [Sphingobium lignivorans]
MSENIIGLINTSIRHIQRSNTAYDLGDFDESFRISSEVISLLCDDGKDYISLFSQINQKNQFPFISTSGIIHDVNIMTQHPQVYFSNSNTPSFKPFLNEISSEQVSPPMSFKKWWNERIFLGRHNEDGIRSQMKRGDFTRNYRNARGAHKSEKIRNKHLEEIIFDGIGLFRGDENYPILSIEKAIMRQIGFEVESSLLLPASLKYPFRKRATLSEEDLMLSERPFALPDMAFIQYNEMESCITFRIKNYGGASVENCQLYLSIGFSKENTSWIESNVVANIHINLSKLQEEFIKIDIMDPKRSIAKMNNKSREEIYFSFSLHYNNIVNHVESSVFTPTGKISSLGSSEIIVMKRLFFNPEVGNLPTK